MPGVKKQSPLSNPVTYLVLFWHFLSASVFFLSAFFTNKLFDPFYPVFVGRTPAVLMISIAIFLVAAVSVVTLAYFQILIDPGPVSAVLQASAVFLFVMTSITFSVIYGSTFLKD
jgi:hypothetical protein